MYISLTSERDSTDVVFGRVSVMEFNYIVWAVLTEVHKTNNVFTVILLVSLTGKRRWECHYTAAVASSCSYLMDLCQHNGVNHTCFSDRWHPPRRQTELDCSLQWRNTQIKLIVQKRGRRKEDCCVPLMFWLPETHWTMLLWIGTPIFIKKCKAWFLDLQIFI